MSSNIMTCNKGELGKQLDIIYGAYNKKEYIHPDPLEFLDRYPEPEEREIAALVASSLAYGRVDQILKHVELVFETIKRSFVSSSSLNGSSPPSMQNHSLHSYLVESNDSDIMNDFRDFRYRFTNGEHMGYFLSGIRHAIIEYGSLKNMFISGLTEKDETIVPALAGFVRKITARGNCGNLAPNPEKGSACKRNNLFLRWMIRKDAVDPGGWDEIASSMLVVPLDTHMHHAGRMLGFTKRKQADMKVALEITEGFRQISPEDPVKYDFCLTRFGIHPDMDFSELESIINIKLENR